SDEDLLGRHLARNDPAAFEALVRRHGPMVLAVCRRVLHDPVDAEDAFQATFLLLLRDARAIRRRPALGGWLRVAAHPVAVRARAGAAAARPRRPPRRAAEAAEPAPPADPSWREACAIVHEELDRLPDRYRRPLLLCYLEGLSRDEAARQLGWTAG